MENGYIAPGILFWIILFVIISCVVLGKKKIARRMNKRYGKGEFKTWGVWGKLELLTGVDPIKREPCTIVCLKNRLVIETDEYEMSIANDKLIDVYVRTKPEEKEYYDDVVGAIAGAEAGGAIGALIGGRGVRKIKDREDYLIIKYLREGKPSGIALDATKNVRTAREVEEEYKWLRNKHKAEPRRKAIEAKNKKKIRVDL